MLLEGKLKRAALLMAVDICLKKVDNSPKRCARNLIELGTSAYPGVISDKEKSALYTQLISLFETGNIQEARTLFTTVFL